MLYTAMYTVVLDSVIEYEIVLYIIVFFYIVVYKQYEIALLSATWNYTELYIETYDGVV